MLLLIINPNSNEETIKNSVDLIKVVESNGSLASVCFKCKIRQNQELTTTHCIVCDQCIFNFNHHCFWVNKCIGKRNLWLFYSFLIAVAVNLGLIIITAYQVYIITEFSVLNNVPIEPMYIFPESYKDSVSDLNEVKNICILILIVCLVFFLPVVYLICVHIYNEYNLKSHDKARKNSKYKQIFSSDSSVHERLLEVERLK